MKMKIDVNINTNMNMNMNMMNALHSVVWYTAMLGKKSSLKAVLKILKTEGIKNVRTTRFDPVRISHVTDCSIRNCSAY